MNNFCKKRLKNVTSTAKTRQKFSKTAVYRQANEDFEKFFNAVFASMVVFQRFFKRIAQTARLMVGVGDYDAYVMHYRLHHAELTPMTKEEYFLNRLQARYPSKKGTVNRCPC